jgi:hypothetical protein
MDIQYDVEQLGSAREHYEKPRPLRSPRSSATFDLL